mmetsp:Transcript_32799/g.70903  ORF Transcript_32799/g.70903 Transcript_32799/m.70903 type:complete len:305 (-) Transcript_32799:137-1051(-)
MNLCTTTTSIPSCNGRPPSLRLRLGRRGVAFGVTRVWELVGSESPDSVGAALDHLDHQDVAQADDGADPQRLLQVELHKEDAHDGGNPGDSEEVEGEIQRGRHGLLREVEWVLRGDRLHQVRGREALDVRQILDLFLADVALIGALDLRPLEGTLEMPPADVTAAVAVERDHLAAVALVQALQADEADLALARTVAVHRELLAQGPRGAAAEALGARLLGRDRVRGARPARVRCRWAPVAAPRPAVLRAAAAAALGPVEEPRALLRGGRLGFLPQKQEAIHRRRRAPARHNPSPPSSRGKDAPP